MNAHRCSWYARYQTVQKIAVLKQCRKDTVLFNDRHCMHFEAHLHFHPTESSGVRGWGERKTGLYAKECLQFPPHQEVHEWIISSSRKESGICQHARLNWLWQDAMVHYKWSCQFHRSIRSNLVQLLDLTVASLPRAHPFVCVQELDAGCMRAPGPRPPHRAVNAIDQAVGKASANAAL